MPAPSPSELKDEKGKNAYIGRCVSYVMKNEGLDQKAALGKCFGMYKQNKQKSKAGLEPEWTDPTEINDVLLLP